MNKPITVKETIADIDRIFRESCASAGVNPDELLSKLAESYNNRFEDVE